MKSDPNLFAEQESELARVTSLQAQSILRFCRMRLNTDPEFHADELRKYVAANVASAPGSPDRILRALRQAGKLHYVVVNRRASLYRVETVAREAGRQAGRAA